MNVSTQTATQANFDIGALYSGQYLKADDLGGTTYPATIAAVESIEIAEQDGGVRRKAAVALQGWPAKLLLNKTNFEAIAAVYGRQSANWIGKPVEVYPDTTSFSGRTVPCVRVRVPRPVAPVAAVPGVALPETAPVAPIAQAALQPTPPMTSGGVSDSMAY